jgi:hypothetical protein
VRTQAAKSLLKSGPVAGLRLTGTSVKSLKVEEEPEATVFQELEETRVRLEDHLGPDVFVQAYRMIEAWREVSRRSHARVVDTLTSLTTAEE